MHGQKNINTNSYTSTPHTHNLVLRYHLRSSPFSFDILKRRQLNRNPLTSSIFYLLVVGLLRDRPSKIITAERIFVYSNIKRCPPLQEPRK